MRRSLERVLTTHVGSLIRPPELLDFIGKRTRREPYDERAYHECLSASVRKIVAQQKQAGIDVPSDGEFGKQISWSQYALERLSGFERRAVDRAANPFARGSDRTRFAEFYAELDAADGPPATAGATGSLAVCVGPIEYTGQEQIQRDIANFKAALQAAGVSEGFLPVAAPASVIPDRRNEYYASDEDCLQALASAMRTEYRAIVDAGLLLQLDDARFAVTYDRMVPPARLADYRRWVALHVEVLNAALEGIPEDRVRYHVCWGSWPGPHTTDVPLRDIVDLVLRVRAGAYLIEGANPRHEHEWRVWESAKLPAGRVLVPGVVSHATNIVEHPELVAERLVRIARLVGPENVMAGTDCGFAQGPFHRRVHPSIMWAKLEALAEGARLASRQLF
ncbi:MAG TPA: cobalamin-independent methionine synthase II family protein [Burkholderiales bacterium]|nr:cobalamin-independent methionine synthase II family protein [Burkholderiales bacterium]